MKIKQYYHHYLALLTLIFPVLFLKLGGFQMRMWDESLFAVNTYEMLQNGNFFSLYFDGQPDLFNTKPPLTVWFQLISVKLFGYNEFALRLPSALAASGVVFLIFNFLHRHFNILWAWSGALILLTSFGFIHFHTARTADSDALLTFFLVLVNVHFLNYVLTSNRKLILYFFIFLSLAFATKLYAALLFAPAYLWILIRHKKFKEFIANRYFFLGFSFFLVSGIGLIILRESESPGYLEQILFKDAGRFVQSIENHQESFRYYLDFLFQERFSFWITLTLLGAGATLWKSKKPEHPILVDVVILAGIYLLVISISTTKLVWYDMPLYPLFAILASHVIILIFNILTNSETNQLGMKMLLVYILIFAFPYYLMFRKSQSNALSPGEKPYEANEFFLFNYSKEGRNMDKTKVYYEGFNGALLFYQYKFKQANQNITLTKTADFKPNDQILVANDSLKNLVKERYQFEILDQRDQAVLLRIKKVL